MSAVAGERPGGTAEPAAVAAEPAAMAAEPAGSFLAQLDDGAFLELSPPQLGAYAEALARAWEKVGIAPGQRVAIWDYGSSPAAYLASRFFAPYLELGAAELTGTLAVCIDGLPDNAVRVGHVLRHLRPRALIARADLVPLLTGGPTAPEPELRDARLVACADGDLPSAGERAAWEAAWPGGVRLVARSDRAALVAPECRRCGALAIDADLYDPLVADPGEDGFGPLLVAARFLDSEPVETELVARALPPAQCCAPERGLPGLPPSARAWRFEVR